MNKILDKIKNVPIGVKAAAVYTLASVFSKGLAIITVPIFTRIMSTSEIGVVNLYNSWNSMLNAVVTLSLTSGGYSAALKEFGKERDQYQSSVLSLTSFVALIVAFIYIICPSFWNGLTGLSTDLMVLIEMLQLLLRLGTFQLSDIFYNTVGGVLGGLMCCVVMKARKRL